MTIVPITLLEANEYVRLHHVGKEGEMSEFNHQEGGSHYKSFVIQPSEYCHKNGLLWCESNIIKYVTRHKLKGKRQDLLKAKHYLDMLIEMDYGRVEDAADTEAK